MDLLRSNTLSLAEVASHLYWHAKQIKCTTYHMLQKKKERYQWWIAMKVKRKGKLDSEEMYVNSNFFQEEQTNCLISNFNWTRL
jgi:hypothetical protein